MKIDIPTADIKAMFATAATGALTAETALAADAKAQIAAMVESLAPLLIAETKSLTERPPEIGQAYIAILRGTLEVRIAELGLKAIEVQKTQIAHALAVGTEILLMVLKAVVVAA